MTFTLDTARGQDQKEYAQAVSFLSEQLMQQRERKQLREYIFKKVNGSNIWKTQ